MDWLLKTADRLENIYLAALRIVVLVLATLALLVAIWIAGDGVRSLLVSTDVERDTVSVSAEELAAAVNSKRQASEDAEAAAVELPEALRKEHDAFLKGPFAGYHRLYVASARRFNKTEDKVLSAPELAEALGYSVLDFSSDDDPTVKLFANDRTYRTQLIAAVQAAAAEPAQTRQLERYKTAQKTDKACRTVTESRRGWDSYSTACDGWWESPIGCPVMRQVPVERCEPAYPADITSPVQAFANLDRGFREIWKQKAAEATERQQAEEARRYGLKASGVPKLTKALILLGLFLGVMFLFLVVAMERHLRKLKLARPETAA